MNWLQKIQELWPNASDDAAEALIWMTPFPFGNASMVLDELTKLRSMYSQIDEAIEALEVEIYEEWKVFKEQQAIQDAANLQGYHG